MTTKALGPVVSHEQDGLKLAVAVARQSRTTTQRVCM
jgi:hypothetical protein